MLVTNPVNLTERKRFDILTDRRTGQKQCLQPLKRGHEISYDTIDKTNYNAAMTWQCYFENCIYIVRHIIMRLKCTMALQLL